MLHSPLFPLSIFGPADNDLEQCINFCTKKLTTNTPPVPEVIRETLDRLECGLTNYAKKHEEIYFRLLRSLRNIKSKKASLSKLIGNTVIDMSGVIKMLTLYQEVFENIEVGHIESYRCPERFNPILELINSVLDEIIRTNAYEDSFKDKLRYKLADLHDFIAIFYFSNNSHQAIYHLQQKIMITDTIKTEDFKESLSCAGSCLLLAETYLKINDLTSTATILRLEREKCVSRGHELYYDICIRLAGKYAAQNQYSSAIAWNNEAMTIQESLDLSKINSNLIAANIAEIEKFLSTKEIEFSIKQDSSDQRSSNRMFQAADYNVIFSVAIPEWSPELIARFKQLAGKCRFDLAPGNLTIHKLSAVGVNGLTKIVDSINKLEKEYLKKLQQQSDSAKDHSVEDLQSSVASLKITAPLAEISPLPSSSSMTPSCSSDPISVPKRTAVKTKTRGKANKRGQTMPKAPVSVAPACDAEKYGFSRSLFGMRAFHECRIRGDSSRVFYVVAGLIEASNKHGDNHQKFARLIPEPKIVPPCGEEGFKWMKVDGRQVLVGKVLDTKKRLFPTVAQQNNQGAIAFMYGKIVNTKNGIPEQSVKHYRPEVIKPNCKKN